MINTHELFPPVYFKVTSTTFASANQYSPGHATFSFLCMLLNEFKVLP